MAEIEPHRRSRSPSPPGAGRGPGPGPEASTRGSAGAAGLRAIPADHEAEAAVLGALLLDHESIYKVLDRLDPASFDLPRHRILYQACVELTRRHEVPTLITLRSYLEQQGQLADAGGVSYLAQIASAVPTAAHVDHHARLVREKGLARALIRTCEQIAVRGYDGSDPVHELVEAAERDVMNIAMGHTESGFTSMQEEMADTFEYIEKVNAGELVGVRTFYEEFDQRTGGLNGGELIILAARPSVGKTALALNFARNHALDGQGCIAFFSLEMTKRELVLRMLMGEAELDNSRLRNGMLSQRDFQALTSAASKLQQTQLFFDDNAAVTVSDIAAKARRLHREKSLTMIVVDYIQLVQGRADEERREQQVADISRSLKLLAKDLGVPVLALSQLNRGPESRPDKRPMLSDLRESGAIEQDADIVLFIYRDEIYDEDSPDQGVAEVIIAKQRNGPVGTIKLQFEKECGRFHNLSRRDDGGPVEAGFARHGALDTPAPALPPEPGGDADLGFATGTDGSGDGDEEDPWGAPGPPF